MFVRHMRKHHTSQLNMKQKPTLMSVFTPPRCFECYLCKCQLENRKTTRDHLRQHLAARDMKCDSCGGRYTSNELQQWHICGRDDSSIHQMSCEYCDEQFDSLQKCQQHLEAMHTDRTLYRCGKCSKYFGMAQIRDLHESYYQHFQIKIERCKICSIEFTRRALINHMKYIHRVEGM